MKKITSNQTGLILVALITCFLLPKFSYASEFAFEDQGNAAADSIYLFSGEVIPTNIDSNWEDADFIMHRKDPNELFKRIEKEDTYYIYTDGEYHLITDIRADHELERLQNNLLEFNHQFRNGLLTLTVGTGMVLGSQLWIEQQASDGEITDGPKYLNYAGYGIMILGGIFQVGSIRFLERGSIDITPVGVKVNL